MAQEARTSLSRRAALYVAAICVVIVGLEVWREWAAHDAALLKAELETHNLARSLRQHAEDSYEIAEQAVAAVVFAIERAGTGSAGLAVARDLMDRTVAGAPRLRGLHIYDADGNPLATTTEPPPLHDNQNGYTYFRNHRNSISRAPFFGPPIHVSGGGGQVITVSQSFEQADGSFGGVVLAALDARYFADFYRGFVVGEMGSISLFDTGGRLLSRTPYRPDLIGADLSAGQLFGQELATQPTGTFQYFSSVDGVERIGAYDSGTRYPIVASVSVGRQEVLGAWLGGAAQRALLTIGLIAGTALLGLRLADQIGRRHRSEAVLAQKEAEFRLLAESASDLVERFDFEGRRIYISPALERLTGHQPAELIGKNVVEVVNPADRAIVDAAANRLRTGASDQETVAFRVQHKDGRELWLETSLRVAADRTEGGGVVGVTRDITERKRLELKLEGMALRDGLTGIANRRAFDDALTREVSRARRGGAPLSLLMIDADRFKRFNDDYGHLVGDTCLKAIAGVVAAAAHRSADLAARYGGEELALLLPGTDLAAARRIATELCRQVEALGIPHERNLPWGVATISIGVAAIDRRDEQSVADGSWLVSTADLALYAAKAQGRNQSVTAPRDRTRLAG